MLPEPSVQQAEHPRCADLLGGLRRLAGRAGLPRPCLGRRGLLTGSSICERANSRAGAYVLWGNTARRQSGDDVELGPEDAKKREAHFFELVSGIEAALNGDEAPPTVIRSGQVVDGTIKAQEQLFYVLPLPERRVEVSINLMRMGGSAPSFSASRNARPTSKHCELKGEVGEAIFRHDPELMEGNSQNVSLNLCIEGGDSACDFRLRCAVRRTTSRPALSRRSANDEEHEGRHAPGDGPMSARARVAEMLALLHRDPGARKCLEDRLRAARSRRRQKRMTEKDYDAINQTVARCMSPDYQQDIVRHAKERRAEKQAQALLRRAEVERATEERMLEWVGREEVKRREREELERQWQEELLTEKRCAAWLKNIFATTFAVELHAGMLVEKAHRARVMAEIRAGSKIQKFIIRKLVRCRRQVLHLNVMKIRAGLAAYCRHLQLGVVAMAQPRLTWFLSLHMGEKQKPSILNSIRNFVNQVRRVQRRYRRIRRIRQARVEALLVHFLAAPLVRELAEERYRQGLNDAVGGTQALDVVAAPPPPPEQLPSRPPPPLPRVAGTDQQASRSRGSVTPRSKRRAGQPSRSSVLPAAAPGGARAAPERGEGGATRRTGFAGLSDTTELPLFVRDFEGVELLPTYIRTHVLYEHVVDMQKSLQDRMREWRQLKQRHQIDEDLAHMFVGRERLPEQLREAPRVLEFRRIRPLYAETYEAFKRGDFKHLVANRLRLMRRAWNCWRPPVTTTNCPANILASQDAAGWNNLASEVAHAPALPGLASARPSQSARRAPLRRSVAASAASPTPARPSSSAARGQAGERLRRQGTNAAM